MDFTAAIDAIAEASPLVREAVPTVPGLVLHVDGDYMAYYAAGNEERTEGEARQKVVELLEWFVSRVGAESIVMHNTSKGCNKGERYLVATVKPYQGQRVGDRKPKNHGYLQDYLQSYEGPLFRAKNWATREADDGIGACAHFAIGKGPGYAAIATADKDMRMLPGVHIDWLKGQVTRVLPGDYDVIGENGKQYGLKWFFLQMLMGDGADNCPGLELARTNYPDGSFKRFVKIGEVGAKKALADCKTADEACAQVIWMYATGYNHCPDAAMDRFCEQAALMWMRLSHDAALTDFAHHTGFSRINRAFTQPVWDAVQRLEDRVKLARDKIDALCGQADPLCTDSTAGR